MRKFLFVAILAALSLARAGAADLPPACGAGDVKFDVTLDDRAEAPSQPEPGKARIFFIHESGGASTMGYPTTKVGVEGAWVGANHIDSYFSVSVEPGEHHVCAALQTLNYAGRLELAHFNAEAGKTYFYRTRLVLSRSVELLELEAIDGDEGRYLVSSLPLSTSKLKK